MASDQEKGLECISFENVEAHHRTRPYPTPWARTRRDSLDTSTGTELDLARGRNGKP
jgi:hypothetical protein